MQRSFVKMHQKWNDCSSEGEDTGGGPAPVAGAEDEHGASGAQEPNAGMRAGAALELPQRVHLEAHSAGCFSNPCPPRKTEHLSADK